MSFFANLPEPKKISKLQVAKQIYQAIRPTFNQQFTEKDYPDLTGKLCIITGMNTGIGFEAVDILLSKNCNVIGVVRSESRGLEAKEKLLAKNKDTKGSLSILAGCDLSNFATVKETGVKLQTALKDKTVNLIIHNAALMSDFNDKSNADGIELMFATNVMGPQLLQAYIDPFFLKNDDSLKRIVWVSSLGHTLAPKTFGINVADPEYLDVKSRPDAAALYGHTKAGNILQAQAYGLKHNTDQYGIKSVSVFPGLLKTELTRDFPTFKKCLIGFMLYPPKYGAISELYGCFYPDLKTGDYIAPFGKIETPRYDIKDALTNGVCLKFWDYVQNEIKDFLPKD